MIARLIRAFRPVQRVVSDPPTNVHVLPSVVPAAEATAASGQPQAPAPEVSQRSSRERAHTRARDFTFGMDYCATCGTARCDRAEVRL